MKTSLFLLSCVIPLLLVFQLSGKEPSNQQEGVVNLNASPELFRLATDWSRAYTVNSPACRINVVEGLNTESTAANSIYLVSADSRQIVNDPSYWKMLAGRNVFVPLMNTGNSFMKVIGKQGIAPTDLAKAVSNPSSATWGTILHTDQNQLLHIYVADDPLLLQAVRKFLKLEQLNPGTLRVVSQQEVIAGIRNNPFAIGFCNFNQIVQSDNKSIIPGVCLLPMDKNGNGSLDNMENIYGSPDDLMRGVWIGKYPRDLYSNFYAVSKSQPTDENALAFLNWILSDGQKYLTNQGFSELVDAELQTQANLVNVPAMEVPVAGNKMSPVAIALIILAAVVLLSIVSNGLVRLYRNRRKVSTQMQPLPVKGFEEKTLSIPAGILFDRSHTWAFMEKDGSVTVGMDDFLQHIIGPVSKIVMKEPGEKVKKGEAFLQLVKDGKQLQMYAPVSGVIRNSNEKLVNDPAILNASPYSEGWIYSLEPQNWTKESVLLYFAEKYKCWISNEWTRIKEFLAMILKPQSPEFSHVVMQDGGVIREGFLSELGPKEWEEFQVNFLDSAR